MAKLYIDGKDKSYPIGSQPIIVGRSSKCDIAISDSHFSRHHFEIGKNDGVYYVKDLNSYNGTFISDKKITYSELKNNDRIVVGKVSFTLRLEENDGSQIKSSYSLLIGQPKKWKYKASLNLGKNTVGRKKGNDIFFADDQMSSHHAEIHIEEGRCKVRDLGSRNGTLLNYKRIEANRNYSISSGDLLQFGSTFCLFRDESTPKSVAKKQNTSNIVIPVVSALLFIAMFVGIYFVQNSYQDNFIPGNLLENFSFEEDNSWQYNDATRIEDESAHSGSFFTHLENKASIEYWEQLGVDYGKSYLVSCWIRSHQENAKSGIKIDWECGETSYNVEGYVVFPKSSSSEWQKYDYVAVPPLGAKSFRVSVVFMGKENEYLDIDNFTIISTNENLPSSNKRVEYQKLKVEMDSCGKVDIYRNKELAVGNILFKLLRNEEVVFDQYFKEGIANINGKNLLWKESSESDTKQFRTEARVEKDGVVIDLFLPKSFALENTYFEYSFYMPIDYTSEVHLIRASDMIVANIDNLSQEEVNQIVWRDKQLGIIYEDNVLCSIFNRNNGLVLQQKFYNWDNNKISIKIKTDYSEDQKQLYTLKELAATEEQSGKLGRAYQVYRQMLGNFFIHNESLSPQREMQRLLKQYQKDEEMAWEYLEIAQFFANPDLYQRCLDFCANIENTWESVDVKKIYQIIETAKNEKENLLHQKNQKKIEPLLAQAKKWKEDGNEALALMYSKEAILFVSDPLLKKEIEESIIALEKAILERN